MVKVLVALTSYSGLIPIEVMRSVIGLRKPSHIYADISGTLCPDARNMMLSTALGNDCTHLFFVDDDNVIHQDSLMTLLELDKDIVGCVYKKRDGYGTTALKRWDDNYLQDNDCRKIFPTDAIGMGCTLIKREVLVAVRAHHNHPFEYLTQPRKLGEDVTFCERAKKLGHEVWAYNGLETGHIGFRNIIY